MCDIEAKYLRKRLRKQNIVFKRRERRVVRRRENQAYKKAKRDAKERLVSWANLEKILNFYANRPTGYEVDHVIPLRGKLASGLHVLNNFQYLLPEENRNKKNDFIPYREVNGQILEYYETIST